MIKYKQRQKTENIIIDCLSLSSFKEYRRRQCVTGAYDSGYHFYIDDLGQIFNDREINAVAKNNTETLHSNSIYVLVNADKDKINYAQRLSIDELIQKIQRESDVTLNVVYER